MGQRGGGGTRGGGQLAATIRSHVRKKMAVEEKGSSTLNNNIKIKNKRCIISKKGFEE
jgi:hypothetical protein